ncbi:SDR family NAD(P)-dependent oxidoreductase [Ruegeria profundi]|uniref:Short-chain dehydrogenase n=1 Tax=Ruegeria profundi TaxID=1685378 RepID=A0A0X3TRX1_9RHOB|nr:SDR family NAD(P)-dependent oxidoreductase [Ruegeria profundi]KUJ78484.1 short-chain dehydrogenase [Ruegeria profundi]
MKDKLCLITGVGDGTGASVARRFAWDGYRVVLLARNTQRLSELEKELPDARSFAFDLEDLDQLVRVCRQIKDEMGTPDVIVHNAVRATFKSFMEADPEELERNFRVNTTSLLYLARELTPAMVERGSGSIIVTGNTAALRGVPNFALFAPTKAAQRIFAQSLARELGPKGIHVAYVVIDAAIDTPWTRIPFNPDEPEEFFSKPDAIAEEVFHTAHQYRSTWSFDVELRPFGEKW